MLDYAIIVAAALGAISLAAMITAFLRRRARPGSAGQILGDQEKASISECVTGEEKAGPKPESVGLRSEDEIQKAREELRVLNLQRQITASAMTTIFEAEAQGKISRTSRDRLVEQYKAQLKTLDEQIAERKTTTELSDLLSERQELVKSFEQRLIEIDERLRQLNTPTELVSSTPSLGNQSQDAAETLNPTTTLEGSDSNEQSKPKEKAKSRAEERLDTIRQEVLKALERLQQIESEG